MTRNLSDPRPFLRWAGSKRQLVGTLAQYWRVECDRYVEPFAGSACLFFRLKPTKALLADSNSELILTYTQVRDGVDGVIAALATMSNSKDEYYAARQSDLHSFTPSRRAALFIYLNRFCFNGLYRTNAAGRFNVPYGGDKSGQLPTGELLRSCSNLLRRAELRCADFGDTLSSVQLGDFVYLDPPFRVSARRVFKEYNGAVFSEQDVIRLRDWLEILVDRKIRFLVSYAASDEADYLSKGFERIELPVRRNIAGFAEKRLRSKEVLIFPGLS